MVYRFKLVSDEASNFMREIEIDSENTFLQLRNCILESVGYTKDELDSFFLCNEDWEMEEEITLEDMGTSSSDRDTWLMDSTPVSELVEEEGQKLVFQFDYMTERIRCEAGRLLLKVELQAIPEKKSKLAEASTGPQGPKKAEKKVGPNDPCPCGSGKKYKHCCGKN